VGVVQWPRELISQLIQRESSYSSDSQVSEGRVSFVEFVLGPWSWSCGMVSVHPRPTYGIPARTLPPVDLKVTRQRHRKLSTWGIYLHEVDLHLGDGGPHLHRLHGHRFYVLKHGGCGERHQAGYVVAQLLVKTCTPRDPCRQRESRSP
jgi:hypothetical protein